MKLLLVVAVALVDADGRVLISERPAGKALAGLWEFPGGKIEPNERPEETLIRELAEEIGIVVEEPCLAPLTFASHGLPGLPSPDAALRLPALERYGPPARRAAPAMGETHEASRLPDAAGGRAAHPGSDRPALATRRVTGRGVPRPVEGAGPDVQRLKRPSYLNSGAFFSSSLLALMTACHFLSASL